MDSQVNTRVRFTRAAFRCFTCWSPLVLASSARYRLDTTHTNTTALPDLLTFSSSHLRLLSIMPALEIDFSQVKMAKEAPEVETSLAVKRTNSNLPSESALGKRTFHQQPFKKRRVVCVSTSTHSSPTISHVVPQTANGDNNTDDLTNLNWLQDANLLKSIYSPETLDKSSDANCVSTINKTSSPLFSSEVIAQRRPPQKSHHRKPPYSYSGLIYLAIESSPTKSMRVCDIYSWIVQHFPFFATAPVGWKNTIRHTLSLRKCFKKVDRYTGVEIADSDSDSGDYKGGFWHVDSEYRDTLQSLVARCNTHKVFPKLVVREGVALKEEWEGMSSKTEPLNDQHHHCHQHTVVSFSGQKFVQVPVIRSFPQRYDYQGRVNRCLSNTTTSCIREGQKGLWSNSKEASYKLQKTINKLSSSLVNLQECSSRSVPIPRRARNSVSVISVNQAPKVYAPLPVSEKSTGTSSTKKNNYLQSPLNDTRFFLNAKDCQLPKVTEHKAQPVLTFSSPHIVCPSNGRPHGLVKTLQPPSDDEDDVLIRDGAEALLNFATGAFSLNRLIKQED